MPRVLGDAFVRVRPDTSTFSRELRSDAGKAGEDSGRQFGGGFKSAVKLGAIFGGGAALAAGAKRLFSGIKTEASDLTESVNAVNVSWGESSKRILRLGKSAATSVGLSRNEFNSLAVQFSSFSDTIAGKGGNSVKVFQNLSQRGADFASVMNLEVNEAMALFQSGLAGETEPLRKFGIDLSAAAVQAHAYKTGIAESGEELTEQQKVQSRYSLLMKSTTKTQGDFANTSDSLANASRILGARWKDLQARLGTALLPTLGKVVGLMAEKGLPAVERLGDGAIRLGRWFGENVVPPLKDTGAAIVDVTKWFNEHRGVALALAGVIAGLVLVTQLHAAAMTVAAAGGMAKWLKGTRLITAITKTWTAVQWALNAALSGNPIALVVIALTALVVAFVIAYKRSDRFREIVQRAWRGIQRAAAASWDVIRPILVGLGRFIMNRVVPAVLWLWRNVAVPAFKAIGSIIRVWWNVWARPMLNAFWTFLTKVLFPVIRFLWERVVKPVFTSVGNKIRDVWQGFIRPAFEKLKEGVGLVRQAFKTAVDRIGTIWEGLKEKAAAPVRFVVNTVYNDGIRKAVNAIPGVGDLPSLHFKRGGQVPLWAGERGKDSVRALLMPGEHVWTDEEVRRAGGHKTMLRMRELARKGRLRPTAGDPGWDLAPGFAEGGFPIEALARAQDWARRQHGKPYIWGGVGPGGFDCSGFLSGVQNVLLGGSGYGTRYGTSGSFPWPGWKPGKGQFTVGAFTGDPGHVSGNLAGLGVESTNGSVRVGGAARSPYDPMFTRQAHLGAAGDYGGQGGLFSKFVEAVKAVKSFAGKIGGFLSELSGMGGWGGMIRQMVSGVVGQLRDWVNDKIPGPGPFPSFDRGGRAHGRGLMLKNTLRPERTLSPRQTEAFEKLVDLLSNPLALRNAPLVNVERMEARDDEAAAYALRREVTKLVTLMSAEV